ncbi:MAG: hypothetical protein IIA49_09475 [Bacteroidetes bacterium]|nr:hypothetical protein [Bacteroidota bacterium]
MNNHNHVHNEHEHKHSEGHEPKGGHEHHDHSHMISDYKKRFWISLGLTFPILLLSPMIQKFLGLDVTSKLIIILF